jgi:hypothetical protein
MNMDKISRRSFVKSSAAGAAAFAFSPVIFVPGKAEADFSDGGFTFHPHMDPLRVVQVHDDAMTREMKPTAPWRAQDKVVDADAVDENIDKLACALAEEKRPKDAWKKLLIKPPRKSWNDTVVAIKTNNIARQHTRSAVMAKICRVLVEMGVKASRIYIYDACHGRDMLKKTPFEGLPEGCNISALWGGFTEKTPVGKPWKDGEQSAKCVEPLVKGEVDLLVNIALCKGHSPSFGRFTMCCKNHLGTFNPRPHAHAEGSTDYLFAINKSPVVLGEADPRKKIITYPRQQLCLIDALWASEDGPGCDSSAQPNRLFMGTFGPVTDYLVAKNFRQGVMEWDIQEPVVDRFLTEFGFKAGDLPDGGKLLEA